MASNDEYGIRVTRDGTTTFGNLSPSAPAGSKVTLTKDQVKILAEIRRQMREEDWK